MVSPKIKHYFNFKEALSFYDGFISEGNNLIVPKTKREWVSDVLTANKQKIYDYVGNTTISDLFNFLGENYLLLVLADNLTLKILKIYNTQNQ